MRIKQVEELVNITSKNIRFYEDQGWLFPERAENGYREYHEKEIDISKLDGVVEDFRCLLKEYKDITKMSDNRINKLCILLDRQINNLKGIIDKS